MCALSVAGPGMSAVAQDVVQDIAQGGGDTPVPEGRFVPDLLRRQSRLSLV